MTIKPIHNNIIIKKIKKEKTGIILSVDDEYEPFYEVIEISEDIEKNRLNSGDLIYVEPPWNMKEIEKEFFVIDYDIVMAIKKKDNE